MKFLVHNADGNILRTGQCPAEQLALQAGYGEWVIEDIAGDTNDTHHRIEGGKRVEFTPPPAPPPSIQAQRARAYPPVGDQLDAIWKIIRAVNAPPPAEATAVADAVLAVKTQFTK